jgi:LPXTG-site transpeptidase (sortase) family protein
VAATKAGPARVPASPPVRIIIPSVGVNAPVVPEGLDRHHALELPPLSAHNLAGWYDKSAMPGQRGASVIAGHVDSTTGTSVFFSIRYLKTGDRILIEEADHHTVTFRVQWVQEASKAAFPAQAVYGYVPYPALRLVTCGGPFDSATGHYLDNIIVYASTK